MKNYKYLKAAALTAILHFAFLVLNCSGQPLITGTFTVTNIPANGATFTINGTSFLWTNAVSSPASQVQITNTQGGNATNMFLQAANNPIAGVISLTLTGGTNLAVQGLGFTFGVTQGLSNWVVLTLGTNGTTNWTPIMTPAANYPVPATATNDYSQLINDINAWATNTLNESDPVTAQLANLDNAQTIGGQKTFSGANVYSNSAQQFVGGTNINVVITNTTYPVQIGPLTVDITGTFTSITDPAGHLIFQENNSSHITRLSDDGAHTRILFQTGGQFYLYDGNGLAQMQIQTNGTTLASTTIQPSLLGAPTNVVCLTVLGVSGQNTNLLEINSSSGTKVLAVGTNQVNVGAAQANFAGSIAITGGLLVTGSETNATLAGTNTINGVLVGKRFNNNSMANGVNQDVVLGTNMDTQLSGETASFSTAGFAGGIDDRFCFVENPSVYNWTINNDSGLDAAPANRIYTGNGLDLTLAGGSFALFKYDFSVMHWKLLFASGQPANGGTGTFGGFFNGTFTGYGGAIVGVNALTTTNYRAGWTNLGNLSTSEAITFTTPLSPTVGTNYSVAVSFDSALAAAVGTYATSKTTNGFTLNLSAGISGGAVVDYYAVPYQ